MSTCPVVGSDPEQETAEMLHQKNVQKALEVLTYVRTYVHKYEPNFCTTSANY